MTRRTGDFLLRANELFVLLSIPTQALRSATCRRNKYDLLFLLKNRPCRRVAERKKPSHLVNAIGCSRSHSAIPRERHFASWHRCRCVSSFGRVEFQERPVRGVRALRYFAQQPKWN